MMDATASQAACYLGRSFENFYRYVTIEMLCTDNMKFWLACQGVFNMRCTTTKLYEIIYNDFLRHNAPYKISVKVSTAEKIKYWLEKSAQLDQHSLLTVEKLLKVAQQEISLQPLGINHQNLDLYCMFHLAVGASQSSKVESKVTKHQSCKISSNFEDSLSFHEEVYRCLLQVQKDRRCMLTKAHQEALLVGKDISSVEWYDFSGYPKKYT